MAWSNYPKSKYNAKKTVFNAVKYDSKKEMNRHCELLLLEKAGAITDLQRQVKFELIPSQRINGKVVERPCGYVADFVYMQNDEKVVEDTKGFRTKDYIIKRKLMLYMHGWRK
jgi:hypothetical protein